MDWDQMVRQVKFSLLVSNTQLGDFFCIHSKQKIPSFLSLWSWCNLWPRKKRRSPPYKNERSLRPIEYLSSLSHHSPDGVKMVSTTETYLLWSSRGYFQVYCTDLSSVPENEVTIPRHSRPERRAFDPLRFCLCVLVLWTAVSGLCRTI